MEIWIADALAGMVLMFASMERGAPRRMRGGAARSNLDKLAQAGGPYFGARP